MDIKRIMNMINTYHFQKPKNIINLDYSKFLVEDEYRNKKTLNEIEKNVYNTISSIYFYGNSIFELEDAYKTYNRFYKQKHEYLSIKDFENTIENFQVLFGEKRLDNYHSIIMNFFYAEEITYNMCKYYINLSFLR